MSAPTSSRSATRLTGRIAVVTGSSSGLGRATALALARQGADVIVHARQQRAAAEQVADAIRQLGRQSLVVLADIAEARQRDELIRQAWQWQSRVDIWINNAGADVLTGSDAQLSFTEKLELLWQVDVQGTIHLGRLAGRQMIEDIHRFGDSPQEPGSKVILNTGWDHVDIGMAGDSGEMFAAIKGAITAFSRSLAKSLAPHVRVNCLAPGWIRTAWGDQASKYWQSRAKHECLLDRWGTAEDVARVACFLASDEASFVNGHVVPVNGGYAG